MSDYGLVYYDLDGNPTTVEEWNRLMEDRDSRRIGRDTVDHYFVSTVWLGIDHNFGDGPPVLWETMIFANGPDPLKIDSWCERYSSAQDAREGHMLVVAALRRGQSTRELEA